MKLFIAGGVGEHGRNCFLIQGDTIGFLVDCGKMADTPDDPYPRLLPDQLKSLDAVFLTHSHADHTGALPWLYENGFAGTVIASEETLRQLPFAVEKAAPLETLCPDGSGQFQSVSVNWGRSGHCAGSVWYRFAEGEKAVLFSGDYTEDTQTYACDPIRGHTAGLAVLDCAYGKDETPYAAACDRLVQETGKLLSAHPLLLFPVPKYGRGLEILRLFAGKINGVSFFGDALFTENLAAQRRGGFWYRPEEISASVSPYNGQVQGIIFVSDPQLRCEYARKTAEEILLHGGAAVMTGTLEKGSYSENLCRHGKMAQLRYPVHLNYAQFNRLAEVNRFSTIIPYHCGEFFSPREIQF